MRGTMVTAVPTGPPRTAKYARLAGYLVAVWRPWHGKPRIPDLLCGLGILVSVLYSLAMIALTPSLIASHPLLLDMLSGSNPAVMAAGSFFAVQVKLPLAAYMNRAPPALLKFDWELRWRGRRSGP